MVLYAGDSQRVQVFNFDRFDFVEQWNVRFDSSLIGRTILINVSPHDENGNKGPVTIDNIGAIFDPWGGIDNFFNPAIKQSILWNFYGATKVTLGPGGGIRFPGSILIPDGDLDMRWPSQDGRTIVKGNVIHNARGSLFPNYEFDPPHPLPLPPTLPVVRFCISPTPPPSPQGPPATPIDPTPAPVPSPWVPFLPPVCLAEGQVCYRTTDGETENRFNSCCKEPNGVVSMVCRGGPWDAVCTRVPGNDASNRLPQFDPKGSDWGLTDTSRTGSTRDSCPNAANLGPLLSKSTGFTETFPLLLPTDAIARGRESEIAFLVGGNYVAPFAAEIEGKIVVLGDFKIGALGTNSLGMFFVVIFACLVNLIRLSLLTENLLSHYVFCRLNSVKYSDTYLIRIG